MEMVMVLTHDEVNRSIPYAVVCEAKESSRWDTGKRRRGWLKEFSPYERNVCRRLFSQAHRWYLSTGVPDQVKMTTATFSLWQRLGAFCASL